MKKIVGIQKVEGQIDGKNFTTYRYYIQDFFKVHYAKSTTFL